LLALGIACFRATDYDAATPWLRQAAANVQTAAPAHYFLGRIDREKGQLNDAVAELQESEGLKPDQPDVLAELGQIYIQLKKYPDAERQLDKAIAVDPDNYAANFGLLQLYARTGDSRRADQSKRFDALKDRNEQQSREMMRVIEIDAQGAGSPGKAP
jgi:tetratricopeptide (TPR) repeat protein